MPEKHISTSSTAQPQNLNVKKSTEQLHNIAEPVEQNEKPASETPLQPRWKRYAKAVYLYCESQWFFFALAILIIIARWWPEFARDEGIISAQYSIGYLAVALIFFKSGCTIPHQKFLKNIKNWRAHFLTQVISFLVTSAISFGFCLAILKSNNQTIDKWVLVGIIVTMNSPTTVASNVVMTKKAGGNETLTVCEVIIGNVAGAFITPALGQLYLQGSFKFGNPANGDSVSHVYRRVMQQIGCCVFVPIFVGQLLRLRFVKQINWVIKTFHLGKLGSWCLLAIMFNSFSTAFYQHAFTSVSHVTIIFVCFWNVGIYLFFTVLSFILVRPFFIPLIFKEDNNGRIATFFKKFYFNKKDATSILFCTSAKTAALGVALITSQYGNDTSKLGKLLVPLVLYQSEQVITANFMVPGFKKWIGDEGKEVTPDEATAVQAHQNDEEHHLESHNQEMDEHSQKEIFTKEEYTADEFQSGSSSELQDSNSLSNKKATNQQ